MIRININNNMACVKCNERLTSGMVGAQCAFSFGAEWDGLSKTAVFVAGNVQRDVLLTGDTCTVPWEVLKAAGLQLYIGVYGTNADGTLVIPTVYANCGGIAAGADPSGDEGAEPTPTLVEQIMAAAGTAIETANSVKAAADAGEFKGDTGERGPAGPTGPKGDKGDAGSLGSVTATVSNTTGAPAVDVTYDGTNANFAFSGLKGVPGPKGDPGEPGVPGPKGDPGEPGVPGPKGDAGATGATGPKGDTGAKGDKGDTGAQGPQGPAGERGPQGAAGPKGDTGAQGPAGPTGATGPQGPKGDKGDPGETPSLAGYATETYVTNAITSAIGNINTLIGSGVIV